MIESTTAAPAADPVLWKPEPTKPPQCRWDDCEELATHEVVYDNGISIMPKWRAVLCHKHARKCEKAAKGRQRPVAQLASGDFDVPEGAVVRELAKPKAAEEATPAA
jgi:hypothetical protein